MRNRKTIKNGLISFVNLAIFFFKLFSEIEGGVEGDDASGKKGPSRPAEHVPREHHPAVQLHAGQLVPAGQRTNSRLPDRLLLGELLQDDQLQPRRGDAKVVQVRVHVRRPDRQGHDGQHRRLPGEAAPGAV